MFDRLSWSHSMRSLTWLVVGSMPGGAPDARLHGKHRSLWNTMVVGACLWSCRWMSVGQQEEAWPFLKISLVCQSNFRPMLQCPTVACHCAKGDVHLADPQSAVTLPAGVMTRSLGLLQFPQDPKTAKEVSPGH
jgi:hypothetical protein